MDYRRYYEKLRIKNEEKKNMFPRRYVFSHSGNNYYSDAMSSNGYRYNFVISSNRSRTYGNNFQGLIVELYISQDNYDSYFNQLLQFKERIEEELNIESIVWQSSAETPSGNVCRIYAKKSVNIDNESRWDEYIDWQINTMIKFIEVLPKYINKLEDVTFGKSEMIEMKIGQFVKEHIKYIIEYCKDNPEELENLQKIDYSKNEMGYAVNYSFLKSYNRVVDENLNERYWNDVHKIDGNNYRVCSQFGGGVITEGKTRSQREGDNFYKYLEKRNLLLEKYKNKSIKFIVGNILPPQPNPVPPIPTSNYIKNITLYGVPGVGKTYNTNKLISLIEREVPEKDIFKEIQSNGLNNGNEANQIIENIKKRVKFITFHQSFGYEDFIEGFRPNEDGDIKLQDGIFKTICNDANHDRTNKYYLVIDEINRGNISKIFGELITLIEEDKRDTFEVTLPYSKKPFKIPSNLYIIGTMNSTDKSIALIDIALRRRFTFLKMVPNLELVQNVKARNIMKELNEKITDTLGADYVLGHSYFMKIENDDDLDFVLEYKIKPLLEEYFYGDINGYDQVIKIIDDNA